MASISGTTSSLSGTLRGFGGMASGIDRDSIIEQMSMGTTTKIQNQKNSITSLTWKQEAFRSIIDKILDLQDNYLSYAATSSVTDANLFAKSVITANGNEKTSKYVSVSGSSDLLESMSVKGVEQLATAANVQSRELEEGAIVTGMSFSDQPQNSNLNGTKLVFGYYGAESGKDAGKFYEKGTFTFPSSYKDENNKTVNIDYMTDDLGKLAGQLNKSIEMNKFKLSDDVTVQFRASADGNNLEMFYAKVSGGDSNFKIDASKEGQDAAAKIAADNRFVIRSNSSALGALGFDKAKDGAELDASKGYSLGDYNSHITSTKDKYIHTYDNMAAYLKGRKFTVSYGGQSKQVELISNEDAAELAKAQKNGEDVDKLFAEKMQKHLDQAFGSGKIKVDFLEDDADPKGRKITFANAKDDGTTLTVTSSDYAVRKETGLDKMSSNKVSLDSSLYENRTRFGFDENLKKSEFADKLKDFTINGVKINATADMSVSQLMANINSSNAGVKASYLSASNKFTLVSKETGSGRDITLGSGAEGIFGGTSTDGKDAVMYVDYGTGAERIVSSSNTFNMDGLKITVSGEFGIEKDADGKLLASDGSLLLNADGTLADKGKAPKFDNTHTVTFTASADVDKAVETVKKFLEDYNALAKAVNTEITTKPDKSYGPLSDEQKDEMNETSIENWEKKAKSGLLYNNGIMRDLSLDIQSVLTKAMGSGISYDDLEEIGITMSDDPYDGGTLKFDENKFKAAMNDDPEKVGKVFAGDGGSGKGLGNIVNDTFKQYATRYSYLNGGSYGRLVEEAGSEKLALSVQNNTIYKQLKDMQDSLSSLQSKLKTEQDRYIQMFTTMEKAISSMNSQSSYLSSLTG